MGKVLQLSPDLTMVVSTSGQIGGLNGRGQGERGDEGGGCCSFLPTSPWTVVVSISGGIGGRNGKRRRRRKGAREGMRG